MGLIIYFDNITHNNNIPSTEFIIYCAYYMPKRYYHLTTSDPGESVQPVPAVAGSPDSGSGERSLASQPPRPRREVLERREWRHSRSERCPAGGPGPELQQVRLRDDTAEPGDHAGTVATLTHHQTHFHCFPFCLWSCGHVVSDLIPSLLFCSSLLLSSSSLSPDTQRGHWQPAGRSWHPWLTWNGVDVSLWRHR